MALTGCSGPCRNMLSCATSSVSYWLNITRRTRNDVFFGLLALVVSIEFAMFRFVFPRSDLGSSKPSVAACLRMCWSFLWRLAIPLPADDFGIFCFAHGVSLQSPFDLLALYFALRCGSSSQKTSTANMCLFEVFMGSCVLCFIWIGGSGALMGAYLLCFIFCVCARLGFCKFLILWAPY